MKQLHIQQSITKDNNQINNSNDNNQINNSNDNNQINNSTQFQSITAMIIIKSTTVKLAFNYHLHQSNHHSIPTI